MKVLVIGASGRMGQELAQSNQKAKHPLVMLGLSRQGVASGYSEVFKSLSDVPAESFDVIIDFSLPEALTEIAAFAVKNKKPLVSGVTGLTENQYKQLHVLAQEVPVLWSANMSLGIAVLTEALEVFKSLEGFDFQIEEIHHNKKKDNPSGTALALQLKLNEVSRRINPTPVGLRTGGVVGVHKVYAGSDEELLCFEHQALNRSVFAKGALRAAQWLKSQGPGYYSLKNVLFSRS